MLYELDWEGSKFEKRVNRNYQTRGASKLVGNIELESNNVDQPGEVIKYENLYWTTKIKYIKN